jgi:hypothetical protein
MLLLSFTSFVMLLSLQSSPGFLILHCSKTMQILSSLDEAMRKEDAPHTIVVACEEDSDEALVASKAGFRTFSAEWFMMIIVKQSLELGAAQFIESVCS